jgi:outer membrane protein
VSIFGQAGRIDGNSFNNQQGKVVNGVRDNVTGQLNAQLNLFTGFNRINQIRQYANQLEAQTYFVNRTAQDLINTMAAQYLTVMLDVELTRIAKQNFDALAKQLEQVSEQVKLGARGPVDEYNQDALTKQAELRYVQAEIKLNNDKALLAQTLLMDPLEEFTTELPSWDVNQIGSESLDINELADRAKLYRGDYLRADKQVIATRFATNAARGFMMPQLTAFATLSSAYNYQHDQPDSVTLSDGTKVRNQAPFGEQFRTNNVQKIFGVQMQIPIFNGLQARTTMEQQKALYRNAQITKQNLEFQIRNDVVRAVRTYEGAKKAYTVTTYGLTAADAAFQLETERYNLGVTNFVDYVNANRVYVQAQTDKAQAEYTLVFQKILLEYAVGTLKPEDFTSAQK